MEDNREAVRIIIGKEKTGGEDPRKSQKRQTKKSRKIKDHLLGLFRV